MNFIPNSTFIKNRFKLKDILLPASLVIVSSNKAVPRSGDQFYPFRQSADLYYLTGIKQEGCTLVIYPGDGPANYKDILYLPVPDEKTKRWDGPQIDREYASAISGIEDIRFYDCLINDLREFTTACNYIYFGNSAKSKAERFSTNEMEIKKEFSSKLIQIEEHELSPLLVKLRMQKEAEELEMIKRAIEITGTAFRLVLERLHPGMKEYEIAALISYEFQRNGIKDLAFDTIVASGKNALILHYVENRSTCKNGEMVLLDFGADFEYYSADISRTIPVNGKFTKRQRALYDANLKVMNQAIKLMQTGKLLKDYNLEIGHLWEEEHVKLGLYSVADIKNQDSREALWQNYYWHGTSHSIGIDVHDCFDKSVAFAPGMVLSCEPGIYIPEEGIGIRLENDILITGQGPVNLSENIPIQAEVIESLMNKS